MPLSTKGHLIYCKPGLTALNVQSHSFSPSSELCPWCQLERLAHGGSASQRAANSPGHKVPVPLALPGSPSLLDAFPTGMQEQVETNTCPPETTEHKLLCNSEKQGLQKPRLVQQFQKSIFKVVCQEQYLTHHHLSVMTLKLLSYSPYTFFLSSSVMQINGFILQIIRPFIGETIFCP